MGGDDVGILVIRRVLHGAEVVNLLVLGDHHHAAGVLSGGALDTHAASGQTEHLRKRHVHFPDALHVLSDIADGGLLRHSTDGTGAEHMVVSKQLKGIAVCVALIFTREVQVDIGYFIAAEAKERLKGNVEAVLFIRRAAHRADGIRHIRAASVPMLYRVVKVGILAVGATVVSGQRVDLRDARHERHQ